MKRIVELTDLEEAALTAMVQQSNAVRLERDADAQLATEAEYFDNDVHAEVLAKYVTQRDMKTEAATMEMFRKAPDDVRAQVVATLDKVGK